MGDTERRTAAAMPDNHQALAVLIGLPLRSLGRAGHMLWLHFGEWREVPDRRKGGTRTVGEWALHVQCEWSISKTGSPVISSADFSMNPNGDDLGDDRDTFGASLFDQAAAGLRAEFETKPPRVTSISCGDGDGFSVSFDDGSQLEVLPGESRNTEAWR